MCVDVNDMIRIKSVQMITWTYKNPARESYFVGTMHRNWNTAIAQ